MTELEFQHGKIYHRQQDIHAKYGGQERGGIATPQAVPYIFLFTGESGEQYGYRDGWDEEGVFRYTGEGQVGDMEFVRGNLAIRDHASDGKDLLLFERTDKGLYRYLGPFVCASWEYRNALDRNGRQRRAIVFHLVRQEDNQVATIAPAPPELTLAELRNRAYQAATPVSEGREREARQLYYQRSDDVRLYVLARAAGICESCRQPAPFQRADGSVYLEPHHTRRVSDGGPDHPRWVGAICPNCHREIHHGAAGKKKNSELEEYLGTIEGHWRVAT
jgi:5-methylcytosine-specific restriction protein A